MLSYRHAYHAGNHADVLKHLTLVALLRHFNSKDTPYCYMDSHSGKGYYDLTDAMAEKNAEHRDGVARLWDSNGDDPILKTYRELLRDANASKPNQLRYYPGSPAIAQTLCRKQDKLILMELHNREFQLLKQNVRRDRRVHPHHRDGFEGLVAMVPPSPSRGLALIDPAYEIKSDYEAVVACVERMQHKWQTGVVAVWFPLLAAARDRSDWLKKRFRELGLAKALLIELTVAEQNPTRGMYGSAMLIVNTPWELDKALGQTLAIACRQLLPTHPTPLTIQWLTPGSPSKTEVVNKG